MPLLQQDAIKIYILSTELMVVLIFCFKKEEGIIVHYVIAGVAK
jgi:hypothetical protein